MDYGARIDKKVYLYHQKSVYASLILLNTVFIGKSLS